MKKVIFHIHEFYEHKCSTKITLNNTSVPYTIIISYPQTYETQQSKSRWQLILGEEHWTTLAPQQFVI